MPTFAAAAGMPDAVERLKKGTKLHDKDFKVHLDGYNFLPFFKGEVKRSPREEYFYFGQGGELNAVRWNDWKVNFAMVDGDIATGTRKVTGWPIIVNLRADPYEKMPFESANYLRWYGDNIWLFVPVQQKLRDFFTDFERYPYQAGSSLNAAGINYQTLKVMEGLKRLQQLESLARPSN
jgi:arylsulfatase